MLPASNPIWLLAIFFTFFTSNKLSAQSSNADSILYQKAVSNVIALYHKSSGDQSGIYNGSQYSSYPFLFKEGHPFFNSDKSIEGSVVYDDILYENLTTQYDEIQDAIIVSNAQVVDIKLVSERVASFEIFGNKFFRIVKDSSTPALIKTGFYNLLYAGQTISLYKKQIKSIREVIKDTDGVLRFIDEKNYYYFKKEDRFFEIANKKDLFKFFADRKKEIQQFIKANHLSFRRDRDNTLLQVTKYYDELKK